MKAQLRALLQECRSPAQASSLLREYLQVRILASLQRAGAMVPLAFHGGTALRLLHFLPRHSEDLAFALEREGAGYDLASYLGGIRTDLEAEGYIVGIKVALKRIVQNAFVSFPGLPFEMGLSAQRHQTLAIKIEVDTNPPRGAGLETTTIRRHVMLRLQHHDKHSLLAGKLHAVLARTYTKGRDLYDLAWYLADPTWPDPNLTLLRNALEQTGWNGPPLDKTTWKAVIRDRLLTMDLSRAVADVKPFLEHPEHEAMLEREHLLKLLAGRA